ncbi:hypothetical protein [Primorskyibacter sp. S187A]|uniref:hypothetical protein n=1 Tax=Primorskyibacter sp. S187A TaxID=3415130 RepID=UPI003C7C8C1E
MIFEFLREANDTFELGLDPKVFKVESLIARIPVALAERFRKATASGDDGLEGLLYDASDVARGVTPLRSDRIADFWATLDQPELARLWRGYSDLARRVPIHEAGLKPDWPTPQEQEDMDIEQFYQEQTYAFDAPEKAASDLAVLSAKLRAAYDKADASEEMILSLIQKKYGVDFVDEEAFNDAWVDRIRKSAIYRKSGRALGFSHDVEPYTMPHMRFSDDQLAQFEARGFRMLFVFMYRFYVPDEPFEVMPITGRVDVIYAKTEGGPVRVLWDPACPMSDGIDMLVETLDRKPLFPLPYVAPDPMPGPLRKGWFAKLGLGRGV